MIFSFKFILIGILFRYFKSVFFKIKKHFRDNDKVRESEVDEPEKTTGPSGVTPIGSKRVYCIETANLYLAFIIFKRQYLKKIIIKRIL